MTDTKRGLMTWAEWQKKAYAGLIAEQEGVFPRQSGIECPNYHEIGGRVHACRANMVDTPVIIECGSEYRRLVHCEVCSFWGCRLLGVRK